MNDKSLIKSDSIILKIKNKIFEIIKKIWKPVKIEEQEIKKEININKEKILNSYRDLKNNKIDCSSLSIKELKMLIRLADEEINILKYKIENEITETKIMERRIKHYKQRLKKVKE